MAISAWLMRWLLAKEWLFAGLGRFCLGLDMPIFTWVVRESSGVNMPISTWVMRLGLCAHMPSGYRELQEEIEEWE